MHRSQSESMQLSFKFSMIISSYFSSVDLLIFIFVVPLVSTTLIASVAHSFETFSPYATLRFFEFSEQGYLLSDLCLRDTFTFLDGLRHGAFWALKLYDATSYYSGGGFGSIKQRFHNPNLCRDLRRNYLSNQQKGVWIEELDESVVPFAVHIIVATYVLEVAKLNDYKWEKIEQLICYPAACHSLDLEQILDLQYYQTNIFVRNITYLKHRIVTDNFFPRHAGHIFKIFFFMLLIIFLHLMLYFKAYLPNFFHKKRPTLIDVEKFQQAQQITEGLNLPKIVERRRNSTLLMRSLDALSLQSVVYNLLDDADITVLSGIFVMLGFCLIYAHAANEMEFMKNNVNTHEQQWPQHFLYNDVNYIFDVYFFVRCHKS